MSVSPSLFLFAETRMTCSSDITIGGYPLRTMRRSYTVWKRFKPEDRIIRSRRKDQHNPHIQDMPWTRIDAERLELEFAYSVTADELRRRLGRAGFTRTTLEQEYLKHHQAHCGESGNMFFSTYPDSEAAFARAEAFQAATLDDWLEALAKAAKDGVTYVTRGVTTPSDILVDIITGRDYPTSDEFWPRHNLLGFPCASLDNMAVALLEVTNGDALCEQEVSMFVEYQGDSSFDDMRLRKKPRQNEVIFDDQEDI
ncbi:HEPN/Toprim-associated domain-containing protein [Paraburkholderia phenoliruptrix]|uniref:HEPN/Toprim-associated domain-containing protein n=1 Tax=Paraburkholderia phenoliruptrix TaxID=252970 RepID=UPI002869DEC8|nr:HEPN/Toprim-associated domain-containing protein [Paraburkholderia phenoliruptrix]WMY10901.1 HEPN/Toprim-associated domain-containing protein [Paraburkholderia phenoliruptrix]